MSDKTVSEAATQSGSMFDTIMSTEPILQFFAFAHLPENLQRVSKPFCDLAAGIMMQLPRNPERTVALRHLLEAKDAAVRARIYK